jgi:long-chain fatty acid transport protein
LVCANSAHAAGLFVSDRGVRPLSRGGAWVAGADDPGAIWYNPAGLADAGTTLFADFSWLNFSSEYKRKTQVLDAAGTLRTYDQYPQVSGTTPFLPIPTLVATYNFGDKKQFTLAGGLFAPYTAIASYPLTVNGQPSPSRYSLVSMDGSALAVGGGYFAFKPIEEFRIGFGLQVMAGKFKTRTVFSASVADRLIGSPEDPSYDALSELDVGPIIAPSGNFGMTAIPEKHVRIGLSGQLPFWVNAPAKVRVRMPSAAEFDHATQQGEDAHVRFRLPPVLRAGVEYRTEVGDKDLIRVEAAYVREFWSLHDSIDIRSENIRLYGITGFPSPFGVAPINIPRNYQDSNSFRLGGEYSTKAIFKQNQTDFRAGAAYETSAVPREWVSPLSLDANKVTLAAGGGIHVGENWRFDATFALVLLQDVSVSPEEAKVPRINPVRGNPTQTEAVNGGDYSARAIILGIGGQYKF